MSDASEIGIRVTLIGGKVAALEADTVSKSVKGIGTAVEETDVKARVAGGPSGGLGGILTRAFGGITTGAAAAGAQLQTVGIRAERAGTAGAVGITKFGEKLSEAETKSKSLFTQWAAVGKVATLGTAAALGVAGYEAGKMAVNFEASTARIASNAGIPIAAANSIGTAFLHTAGYMTVSGQEMAEAFGPVAGQMASISGQALTTGQSLTFMKNAAQLGEATETDLNSTTAALAKTMQAYHMTVADSADASDLLFNISKQTNTGLGDLSNVVSVLHARLGQAIPSLGDMGGLMESLIHQGATSSRSLRMVQQSFSTLLSGSKPVNDMLKSLGVNIFDSSGKFIGMSATISALQPRLAALPPQLQFMAEQTLFGAGAEQLMGQVVLAGAKSFDVGTAAVMKHDSAHEAAEKAVNTTRGQYKVFKSELDDWVTMVGQKVLPLLLGWGNYLLRHRALLAAVAIVVGVVIVAAIGTYIASVIIATSATAVFWSVATLGIAVAAVAIVAGILWLAHNWSRVWGDIKQWTHDAYVWVRDHMGLIALVLGPLGLPITALLFLATHWRTVWHDIRTVVEDVWKILKPIFDAIGTGIGGIAKAIGLVGKVGGGIGGGIAHGIGAVGSFLGFAEGGIVPGPVGNPVMAMVHGGEMVIPAEAVMGRSVAPVPSSPGTTIEPTPMAGLGGPASEAPSVVVNATAYTSEPTGAGQPMIVQLVVDRKVLAQATFAYTRAEAARS